VCIGGQRAAPAEDCWGAWGYLERLDQQRLYPPLEAMGGAAAISTLCAADPQTSVRAALGDLDAFREAVDCLAAYAPFRPAHFDRHTVNAYLPSLGGLQRRHQEGQGPRGDHH